jgi:hypothetical protein
MFRCRGGQFAGNWKKLHKMLYYLFSSPCIDKRMKQMKLNKIGNMRNAYKNFIGKPCGKRLEELSYRWENVKNVSHGSIS